MIHFHSEEKKLVHNSSRKINCRDKRNISFKLGRKKVRFFLKSSFRSTWKTTVTLQLFKKCFNPCDGTFTSVEVYAHKYTHQQPHRVIEFLQSLLLHFFMFFSRRRTAVVTVCDFDECWIKCKLVYINFHSTKNTNKKINSETSEWRKKVKNLFANRCIAETIKKENKN